MGRAEIVIVAVATTTAQPFAAGIVLVTVYVPGVLEFVLTTPVAISLKFKPVVEVKTPATPPPEKVGVAINAF
jgi:hypothetical protein